MSRNPICPVLVDATLVILPKLACVTVRTGSLYCSQLNALKASARDAISDDYTHDEALSAAPHAPAPGEATSSS